MRLSGADAQISELAEQARRKPVLHFTGSLPLRKSRGLEAHLPLFSRRENGDAQPVAASKLFVLDLPSDLAVVDSSTVDEKDVEGQAVRLFSRGLNYAGVRNLLLSLWDSGDSGRMSELLEFYRSNQMGLSQAQSLRKAQLLALRDDPSPAKWAAFQLLGPGM